MGSTHARDPLGFSHPPGRMGEGRLFRPSVVDPPLNCPPKALTPSATSVTLTEAFATGGACGNVPSRQWGPEGIGVTVTLFAVTVRDCRSKNFFVEANNLGRARDDADRLALQIRDWDDEDCSVTVDPANQRQGEWAAMVWTGGLQGRWVSALCGPDGLFDPRTWVEIWDIPLTSNPPA